MILNLGTAIFNTKTATGGGTPAWGTEMGQGDGYKFSFEDYTSLITSLVYNSVTNPQSRVTCPLGKGGNSSNDYEFVICGHYTKIFVNDIPVPKAQFDLLVIKKLVGEHHVGRRTLKYNPRITLDGNSNNAHCFDLMAQTLGVSYNGSWFISEINALNQDELHFTAHILNKDDNYVFKDSTERSQVLSSFLNPNKSNEIAKRSAAYRGTLKIDPLQTIFFGSPGTGKSYYVEHNVLNGVPEEYIFRTTFHPDSDYASFVGTYKPISDAGRIDYNFEPQVFTEAYVKAWNNPDKDIYLVIEEINRGNCAQIFGDLFQLLDRKGGVSEYPIKADAALAKFLSEKLTEDAADGIRDGKLRLPANLNIIATMNTSDQSLFPMDSAFKRRWDWKYIPTIPPSDQEKTLELDFKETATAIDKTIIDAGAYYYKWTDFLKKINKRIKDATHSDDKQLGFWFVKTEEGNNNIPVSTFVSKVIFYLWNDIFKDYGSKGNNPFTFNINGKIEVIPFSEFFEINSEGQTVENIGVLHTFMKSLEVEANVSEEIQEFQDDRDSDGNPQA